MIYLHQYFTYNLDAFIIINILQTHTFGSLANNKYKNDLSQNVSFHQGLECMLRHKNSSRTETHYNLKGFNN